MKTKEQLKREILNDFVPDWEKEGWKFSYDSNDIEKLVDETIEKAREGWMPKKDHKDELESEKDYRKMLDEKEEKKVRIIMVSENDRLEFDSIEKVCDFLRHFNRSFIMDLREMKNDKEREKIEDLELVVSGLPPCECCGFPAMIREEYFIGLKENPGGDPIESGSWIEVEEWTFAPESKGRRVRCPMCKAIYKPKESK